MLIRKIFSFATLTLLVALTLSAIAAWYSIQGLMAIFAAAVIPIMIMGGSLEIAKVVTTVWLHRYWDRAGWTLKAYLIPAVIALAFLTSMGIFGFLSKAHSDQTLISGDVGAKIAIYDEQIQTARDNIDTNRKALQQMDAQVDQLLGRTTDDAGANRAVQVRRQQRAERTRLQNEIATEQETISRLQDEAAPIRAQVRRVEAEVGPIKYIAALIYGDNPDTNLLERAVRWVIILIVFVFDPLALTLVLAAQSSYKWLDDDLRNRKREDEDEADEEFKETFLGSEGTLDKDLDLESFLEENLDDIFNTHPYEEDSSDVTDTIQPDPIKPDEVVGEDVHETPVPDASSTEHRVDEKEIPVVEEAKPARRVEPVVKTEGVTIQETEGGYINYQGKSISKDALRGMHPELFLQADSGRETSTKFGTAFPSFAKKGDIFVRVDVLPNKVFKFSGEKWIETNKNTTSSYLYDEEYIRYLVSKIETGEYDIDLLSETEKEQIEDYLNRNQN